jgi:CHAT domain-containing protein/tetratricopeptide (TPR) repeat protein
VSGARHRDYALSLNSLARLHKSMGHYETALNLLLEAKSIYQESLGIKHPDYAISLKNLGLLYKDMGNYDAALPLLVEVIGIRKEALGYNHPEYAFSLKSLASLYLAMGNYTTALPLWEEANLIINHNVQDNFSFLTQNEKEIYFSKVGDIYDVYLSFLKKDIATSAQYCGQAYNNELLLKGLILTSVAGMQQAVLASGDTSLTRPYEEMRVLKRQITAEQQKPITKRRSDLTAIELRCKELEEDLTRRSQAFGRMQSSFKLKWQDVQDQLGENEASIEFVSFRYFGDRKITDSTYYYAFVLRRHDPSPQLVYLCEETELTNAIPPLGAAVKDINILYQGQALHKLVWQPLDTLLEGVKTVYYAPSGLLNSVSMAAICGPDRKMLMEKYELVQLSSTRSLAMTRKPDSITDAVVYGGIAYDTDTLTLLTKTESYNQKECDALTSVRSIAGSTRNGFRYLPGAEREARIVLSKLANKGIASKRYFGTDAVEESFVALSGRNSPSLIHLSTHGFYYPDTTEGKQHSRIPPLATGEARFRYSNDPLIRSGLLMAGANIAWKGLPLPQHIEDGILTAKEVSNMNLMNTQLVVLSACQTGQGDVKGNEGVEGLQRGFKMAGVRYLIMSLWEVPDKETTEFMESFYDNFLGGKEIHDAFRTAQAKMRNDYKNEPFKWAAFVLME